MAMTSFLLGGFSHSTWYKKRRSRQPLGLVTRFSGIRGFLLKEAKAEYAKLQ